MFSIDFLKAVRDIGVTTVVVVALVYLVIYMVKYVVNRQSLNIDKLGISMEKLWAKLEKHEERAETRGGFVRKEHEAMIRSLEKINEKNC